MCAKPCMDLEFSTIDSGSQEKEKASLSYVGYIDMVKLFHMIFFFKEEEGARNFLEIPVWNDLTIFKPVICVLRVGVGMVMVMAGGLQLGLT